MLQCNHALHTSAFGRDDQVAHRSRVDGAIGIRWQPGFAAYGRDVVDTLDAVHCAPERRRVAKIASTSSMPAAARADAFPLSRTSARTSAPRGEARAR